MRTVNVSLGERSYLITIDNRLISRLGVQCRRLKLDPRCALITDRQVGLIYAQAAEKALRKAGFEPVLITVPAGETAKSLKVVQSCYTQLAGHRLERKSFVVALGGGAGGLLGGWLASAGYLLTFTTAGGLVFFGSAIVFGLARQTALPTPPADVA
jgi:3-dehydroquinate synthase